MARSGDTKLLCHVAQMSIALSGVSLWPLSGGKSLVLCQPGSQGTPRAYSSRRSRGDPLYLNRAVTTSPQTREGLCPGASGHVPPLCGTTILLRRSAHLTVAPLVTVCDTHVHGSRICTASPWPLPATTTLRPAYVGPGRHTCPPAAPCSIGHRGQGRGEASQARPLPAASRAGPEKGAMAILDDAEVTTYRMLQQVLQ